VDILDQNVWPVVAKCYPESPWIFKNNNATPHKSRINTLWTGKE